MSLSRTRIEAVRGYLARQFKFREIQRLTGVTRKVIRQIAAGTYKQESDDQADDEGELPRVPAYRCQCGFLVEYHPCQICAALAHRQRAPATPDPDEPLELDLAGDRRLLYLDAREHRRRIEAEGSLLHCL